MLLDGLADGRPRGPLTAREQEIVGLIARGMRDGDIAAALSLSRHTVHRHVANILAKLGCPTRAAAVVRAAELGML
jgi:DNA-binding NarL/FixJ family response regulator